MPPLIKEIAKAALKFYIFGAVLALAGPYIGAMAGLAPTVKAAGEELGKMGDPVLVGAAFAVIGMLDAVMKPLFKKLFKTPDAAPGKSTPEKSAPQ